MSFYSYRVQHIQLVIRLPTHKHPAKGFRATAAQYKATLAVKKAQLHLVNTQMVMQNPMEEVAHLVVATMKVQIQPLVEALHLETQKKPFSSTF